MAVPHGWRSPALIFAVSRPLAGGWLGLAAGGRADTTIVLLDRSPSMQQQAAGGGVEARDGPASSLRGRSRRSARPLGADRQRLEPAAGTRIAVARCSTRRAPTPASASADLPADAAGGPRLHPGTTRGPHRDLDLLRPPAERLERRQRPLAGPARRVPRVPAGRPVPPCWPIRERRRATSRSA